MKVIIDGGIKCGTKLIYPDQLGPETKAYADRVIAAHRKAYEHPDWGLGKPVTVWWDENGFFCVEYILSDGTKHWYHYEWTRRSKQFDGLEWWHCEGDDYMS